MRVETSSSGIPGRRVAPAPHSGLRGCLRHKRPQRRPPLPLLPASELGDHQQHTCNDRYHEQRDRERVLENTRRPVACAKSALNGCPPGTHPSSSPYLAWSRRRSSVWDCFPQAFDHAKHVLGAFAESGQVRRCSFIARPFRCIVAFIIKDEGALRTGTARQRFLVR